MIKIETLVIALGNQNGAFDLPDSKAFQLRNPILLRTYRPEKKVDSEHFRVFTSIGGGIRAAMEDIIAKCNGKNHRLSPENTLRDLLAVYGFTDERACRRIIVFLQKSLGNAEIYAGTKISWLLEIEEEICQTK